MMGRQAAWSRHPVHADSEVKGKVPPKAKTKGGASGAVSSNVPWTQPARAKGNAKGKAKAPRESGAAAPHDDPQLAAKAEGKGKGTALEPPAKATPTGGASGAAVSSEEPQPPAFAKDKGAAAAIHAEGADGALEPEFYARLDAPYDPHVPSAKQVHADSEVKGKVPPKAKTKGGASGAVSSNVEPAQPAKAKGNDKGKAKATSESGAAAPNDDPQQPANAEGKGKGKALEPPTKACLLYTSPSTRDS